MKRINTIFFVIASVFMLYTFSSCSRKEVINHSDSESIAFSPAIGTSTKATSTTSSNIQQFTVEAFHLNSNSGGQIRLVLSTLKQMLPGLAPHLQYGIPMALTIGQTML